MGNRYKNMLKYLEMAETEQKNDTTPDVDFFKIIEKTLKEHKYIGAKIYFHMDLDGVASALAMKELLLKYNLPTVEELAAKVITTKLPINKLPPEVIEAFRQESLKQGPKSLPKDNYIG